MSNLAESQISSNIVDGCRTNAVRKGNLAALDGTFWIDAIDKTNTQHIALAATRTETDTADNKIPAFGTTRKLHIPKYRELIDGYKHAIKLPLKTNNRLTLTKNALLN